MFIFWPTLIALCINIHALAYELQLFKVNNEKNTDNLEEVFVHRAAWFNVCDFAYTDDHDWGAPRLQNPQAYHPSQIPIGSTIYVSGYGISKFLKEVHPHIQNPYILITMYYAPGFEDNVYVNDAKLIAWFGSGSGDSLMFKKYSTIPLGIFGDDNLYVERKKIQRLLVKLKNKPKSASAYMNFCLHEWCEKRKNIHTLLKDKPFIDLHSRKPFMDYIEESAGYRFVISPAGDMPDCYRHWEALLTGSIPIISSSSIDELFQDLPVIIVKDYAELTEDFLHNKYAEIVNKKYNFRKLYMQYWVDKINEIRKG